MLPSVFRPMRFSKACSSACIAKRSEPLVKFAMATPQVPQRQAAQPNRIGTLARFAAASSLVLGSTVISWVEGRNFTMGIWIQGPHF